MAHKIVISVLALQLGVKQEESLEMKEDESLKVIALMEVLSRLQTRTVTFRVRYRERDSRMIWHPLVCMLL